LNEPLEEIKECKLKEIRSLQKINWQVEIQTCETLERALIELVKIFEQSSASSEERAFVKTTAIAIQECLKRKLKYDVQKFY
jgi:hypothetical protein